MRQNVNEKSLKEYLQYLLEEEKSTATIDKYQRDIRKLFRYLEVESKPDKQKIIEFKQYLARHYTAVSVNSMLAAVNSFLSYLGYDELRVKPLRIQKQLIGREEKELSKEEYLRLLSAAKKHKDEQLRLVMQTISATGIRISELPYITVAAVKKGKAQISCKNKNRVIFLPAKLRKMLTAYSRQRGIEKGAVFVTRNGRPLHRNCIWRKMKDIAGPAGVVEEKVFPHNLRHLFARTYYQMNKDIVALSDILGHSYVETTRIYTISVGNAYIQRIEALDLLRI